MTRRLNDKQLASVQYIAGPLLVLAGAGSGKTGVITNKIVYLINECNYHARNVVALTFTNKAAREMKERVTKMANKKDIKGLWVSTFHTLGLRILKEDSKHAGLSNKFSIFDQRDCFAILKEITQLDDDAIKGLQSQISNLKNNLSKYGEIDPQLAQITEIYNNHLLALNAVDFDDLILHCLKIFADNPTVLSKWRSRIRYLLLDEYQDTNQSQYQLIQYLVGESGKFTAVGDDDQSIYSWRGADAENLKALATDFPALKVIKLEQNYRCDKRILSISNALIANNSHLFEKALWSDIENGDEVSVIACDTDAEEAQTVITTILSHSQRFQQSLSDYAILYRGNYQSRALEKQLRLQRVPYEINGATAFFEHAEIRDLLAYMRLVANPDDQRAFVRIINTPRREIGTVTLQKLSDYCKIRQISFLPACLEVGLQQTMGTAAYHRLYEFASWIMQLNEKAERQEKPSQILDWIIGDTEYEDYVQAMYEGKRADKRLELIADLREWVIRLEEKDDINDLSDLIQRMQLLDMLEQKSEAESTLERVSLMTLHAAKGLEFPFVFIIGLEEGLLPHQNCLDDENMIEEERRLLYVGITRAKRKLWLSLANNRRVAGNMTATNPSRFLDEFPKDEIDWHGINEVELSAEEREKKLDNIFDELLSMVGD